MREVNGWGGGRQAGKAQWGWAELAGQGEGVSLSLHLPDPALLLAHAQGDANEQWSVTVGREGES